MVFTLLEGYDHMSKFTDVEVSAFSECFLFSLLSIFGKFDFDLWPWPRSHNDCKKNPSYIDLWLISCIQYIQLCWILWVVFISCMNYLNHRDSCYVARNHPCMNVHKLFLKKILRLSLSSAYTTMIYDLMMIYIPFLILCYLGSCWWWENVYMSLYRPQF